MVVSNRQYPFLCSLTSNEKCINKLKSSLLQLFSCLNRVMKC